MVSFLSPIWLLALFALAIPLAIHLWSRGEQRVVRVGSVRLIQASTQKQPRQIRISNWLLLLVQVVLLVLAALALARPAVQFGDAHRQGPQRHVLVSPDALQGDAMRGLLLQVDSLVANGYQAHILAPGFPSFTTESEDIEYATGHVWSLLRAFDAQLPDSSEIVVIATPYLHMLQGVRPALASQVTWSDVGSEGRNFWVDTARNIGADSLWLVVARSDGHGTQFDHVHMRLPESRIVVSEGMRVPVEIVPEADPSYVRLLVEDGEVSDNQAAIVPAASYSVSIVFDEGFREDVPFVRAALEAAAYQAGGVLSIEVEVASTWSAASRVADRVGELVFWLSELPVPDVVLRRVNEGGRLVQYASMKIPVSVKDRVFTDTSMPAVAPRLFLRAPNEDATARSQKVAVRWTDGYGDPLLTQESVGKGYWYNAYLRFHPEWTDLVHEAIWPVWMTEMIRLKDGMRPHSLSTSDRRRVAIDQVVPVKPLEAIATDREEGSEQSSGKELFFLLWVLVLLVFLLERWLSKRQRDKKDHPSAVERIGETVS